MSSSPMYIKVVIAQEREKVFGQTYVEGQALVLLSVSFLFLLLLLLCLL